MPRTRLLTIGAGILAATGIAAAVPTLIAAWEPLCDFASWLLPALGWWLFGLCCYAMLILTPFLLVGLGLVLFPINTDEFRRGKKPANSDLGDL